MYRVSFGQTKYHNKRTTYGGHSYMSKLEADVAWQLDIRKKAHDIVDYRRQVAMPLDVNGKHICTYIVDFVLDYPDGTIEYLEVKGFETDVWRIKWKLFTALYEAPNVIFRVQKR